MEKYIFFLIFRKIVWTPQCEKSRSESKVVDTIINSVHFENKCDIIKGVL